MDSVQTHASFDSGASTATGRDAAASPASEPVHALVRLRPMHVMDLDVVADIEQRAYPFPWSRGNFVDSLAAGYVAQMLIAPHDPAAVTSVPLGYYLAMPGFEEMHLLNITVAPGHEHRGHARTMLRHLMNEGRLRQARTLWLEVRESNERARRLYERWGFEAVGQRKGYYPAAHGQREHAIVMSLPLGTDGAHHAMD